MCLWNDNHINNMKIQILQKPVGVSKAKLANIYQGYICHREINLSCNKSHFLGTVNYKHIYFYYTMIVSQKH